MAAMFAHREGSLPCAVASVLAVPPSGPTSSGVGLAHWAFPLSSEKVSARNRASCSMYGRMNADQ